MMRSLWTAGQGMMTQQTNVDVISNNLSNVNTTAYKKERVEFKDLLYDTMSRSYLLDGKGKPVNLQVGSGAAPVATMKNFSTGAFEQTENPLDLAINGEGFFVVKGARGNDVYTRDGSFKISAEDQGNKIVTSDGYSLLDESGNELIIPKNISMSTVKIDDSGNVGFSDPSTGVTTPLGQKINIVKFSNRQGLESIGGNFYNKTSASGEPTADAEMGDKSLVTQSTLEASNVQVVEEMVKMIVAQRAYEINSKAIQTSDDMLGLANNLKR